MLLQFCTLAVMYEASLGSEIRIMTAADSHSLVVYVAGG